MAVVGIVVRNNDSEWGGVGVVGGEASDDSTCTLPLQDLLLSLALQNDNDWGTFFFLATAGATYIKMLIGEICALPPCYS